MRWRSPTSQLVWNLLCFVIGTGAFAGLIAVGLGWEPSIRTVAAVAFFGLGIVALSLIDGRDR